MRDYWLTKDLLQATGIAFIVLSLIGIALALWLPKKWWGKLLALVAVGFLISIPVRQGTKEVQQQQVQVDDFKERYAKAKALFDERCKTAGEKIYRTVENVEGVLLLNVRPTDKAAQRANPNWPDAGLPNEVGGDDYIRHFLYWEHKGGSEERGYLNSYSMKSFANGYKYVEIKQTDGTFRYTLLEPEKNPPQLLASKISGVSALYSVGFTNFLDPEDRKNWVAGTKVTLKDVQTDTVLAEKVWYSFEPGLGSVDGARQPWGFAQTCPSLSGWNAASTRFFADRILKPKQGN